MKLTDSKLKIIIWSITILIPVVVTLLGIIPPLELAEETRKNLYLLPKMNAIINGTTFFVLLGAWIAIRSKNIKLHKTLTSTAIILSVLFLLSYIVFHFTIGETSFPKENPMRPVYLFILATHIVLSAVIVPLVLFTYARGWAMEVEKHKKLAHFTWPIWLYVTATGVIVYLMISPCYPI